MPERFANLRALGAERAQQGPQLQTGARMSPDGVGEPVYGANDTDAPMIGGVRSPVLGDSRYANRNEFWMDSGQTRMEANDPYDYTAGRSQPEVVGTPPRQGLAPANVGQDGRIYIGDTGTSHYSVTEKYPDVQFGGGTGFVTPEGRFLDRSQALDYVNANGENVRPSSNMPGELDALDYRDQVANRRANMDAEGVDELSISAPVREVDRIDVGRGPPPPTDFVLDAPPLSGRARPMEQRPSPEELAAMAERVEPGDVTPIPANAVESLEEAQAIGAGMRPPVRGGDERAVLETRRFPSTRDASRTLPRKGPLDLVSWLRANGGVKPQGGELAHMGIDNAPRSLDFAQAENRLGKLVDGDNGLDLDEAAGRAWEAGYFPDHVERPTVAEFLDALGATHSGRNRSFRSEDLAEVDNFEAARRQRFAVEQAEQEGRPLVDDLGQPITQADLDTNAPPATAYEDLPKVGGRVGNIDLSRVETRGDIRRLLQTTENRAGGFDAARRGRMSQGETEALASELGMTANDLLKRRKGQALNAEEALAARQLLAKSADELIRLAQRVNGGSDEELSTFRRAWLRHAAIQEQVTGATAEAGRALAQFKMAARAKAIKGSVHSSMVEGAGGRDRLEEAAKAILDLQARDVSPGAVNKFAADALKPKLSDKLVELWYNSICRVRRRTRSTSCRTRSRRRFRFRRWQPPRRSVGRVERSASAQRIALSRGNWRRAPSAC